METETNSGDKLSPTQLLRNFIKQKNALVASMEGDAGLISKLRKSRSENGDMNLDEQILKMDLAPGRTHVMVIGCVPVRDMETPPDDQTDCQPCPCEMCKEDVWLSAKKRELISRKQEIETRYNAKVQFRVICFECLIKLPQFRDAKVQNMND